MKFDVKLYREDFPKFALDHLRIQTKHGELIPFELNRVQRRVWDMIAEDRKAGRPVRMYFLKARQLGMSTLVQGLAYWKTTLWPNQNAYVVAHALDPSTVLFDKSRIFYENADHRFRPMRKKSNRKELHFANPKVHRKPGESRGLESRILVDTADNKNLGVSYTLHFLHLSELAAYEEVRADIRNRLPLMFQAVPTLPETYVFFETTARGMGLGKEYWDADDGYHKVFISWCSDDEYRLDEPLVAEDLSDHEESEYGNELAALKHVLHELELWYPEIDDPQARMHEALCRLAWRRRKIRVDFKGDRGLFRQEYPLYADEAFVTSGDSVFDGAKLHDIRMSLYERDEAGNPVALTVPPEFKRWDRELRKFYDSREGPLRIYEKPVPSVLYTMGVDVSEGVGDSDYSAVQVLRLPELKQVAVFKDRISPDDLADLCFKLGGWYNWAYCLVETNAAGFATNLRLTKHLMYPNLYYREVFDNLAKTHQMKSGWNTNAQTKNVMVTDLRAAIDNDLPRFHDPETLQELGFYVLHRDGKMGAVQGQHDDLVMAFALALQGAYSRGYRRLGKGLEIEKEAPKLGADQIEGSFEWWARMAERYQQERELGLTE